VTFGPGGSDTRPCERTRDLIAEAVHEAVVGHTGGTGAFRCLHYAFAGMVACSRVTGKRYVPQVGSMDLLFDPAHPRWLPVDATGGGLARNEFHAWTVYPGAHRDGVPGPDTEVVDFSARHYPALVAGLLRASEVTEHGPGGSVIAVRRPSPRLDRWSWPSPCPAYVWHAGTEPMGWLTLHAVESECLALVDSVREARYAFLDLAERTHAELERRFGASLRPRDGTAS
jgi:hypothetical protein